MSEIRSPGERLGGPCLGQVIQGSAGTLGRTNPLLSVTSLSQEPCQLFLHSYHSANSPH